MILNKKLYMSSWPIWDVISRFFSMMIQLFWVLLRGRRKVVVDNSPVDLGQGIVLQQDDHGNYLCVACKKCVGACPTNSIDVTVNESGKLDDFFWDHFSCIECGECIAICPEQAIWHEERTVKLIKCGDHVVRFNLSKK